VMLVDDTGETLKTVATHGLPESPLKSSESQKIEGSGRPAFYSGHTARAFREKRVCIVDDVFTDVEFVPWKVLAQCDGYAVSAPLVYQDVALGVLNLFFDAHVPLNDERIRLFETLASAAAVSVANAQLYDRALESHPSDADTANLFRLRLAS
jgi:GAF domain-containing protein